MKNNNVIQYLILTVVSLTAIIASWNMYNTPSKSAFGAVLLAVSICGTIVVLVMAIISSNMLKKYIMKTTAQITKTEKESLYNFPAPVVIIDEIRSLIQQFSRKKLHIDCISVTLRSSILKSSIPQKAIL